METPNYTRLARWDWVLVLLITFPIPFVQLISAPLDTVSYASFVPELALSLSIVVGLALVIDHFRGHFSPPSASMDEKMFGMLQDALNAQHLHPSALKLARTEVVASDYALGAHVRGVIFPRVVMSAGLVMGLLMRDPRAQAILSHEISHIRHFDRFIPGLLGMIAFEIVGIFLQIATDDDPDEPGLEMMPVALLILVYKIIVLGGFFAAFSRYREYYADAAAMAMTSSPQAYIELLKEAAEHEKSSPLMFHPSSNARVREASGGFKVLRNMKFWRVYLLLAGLMSLVQYRFADDEFVVQYAGAAVIVFTMALMFELIRTPLLSVASNASRMTASPDIHEVWQAPKERRRSWNAFPISFLLIGFLIVITISLGFPEQQTVIRGIGGSLVYLVYRSLRRVGRR